MRSSDPFDELLWRSVSARSTLVFSEMQFAYQQSQQKSAQQQSEAYKRIIDECCQLYLKNFVHVSATAYKQKFLTVLRDYMRKALFFGCIELATTIQHCIETACYDVQGVELRQYPAASGQ